MVQWCCQSYWSCGAPRLEMTEDFRRKPPTLTILTILNSIVSTVATFKFLGSTISQDLKRTSQIDAVCKKAPQRLYFLRQLRRFNVSQERLITFYSAIIQSVLCTSTTVWFGSVTTQDRYRLQRPVRSAEKIIWAGLPSIYDLFSPGSGNRQETSLQTPHTLHTNFSNFSPLEGMTELCAKTTHHRDSFFPQAVILLNLQ